MTPTRDRNLSGPQLDTGTASPLAKRPNVWQYAGPADVPSIDTGIGTPVAVRQDLAGTGTAFIPPLWR